MGGLLTPKYYFERKHMRILLFFLVLASFGCTRKIIGKDASTALSWEVVLVVVDSVIHDHEHCKNTTWFRVVGTPNAKFHQRGYIGEPGEQMYLQVTDEQWMYIQAVRKKQRGRRSQY